MSIFHGFVHKEKYEKVVCFEVNRHHLNYFSSIYIPSDVLK